MRQRRSVVGWASLGAALFLAVDFTASADDFSLSSGAWAYPGVLSCTQTDGSNHCTLSGNDLSIQYGVPLQPVELSGTLDTISTFGSLSLVPRLNGLALLDGPHVYAQAGFFDTLHIAGYTGSGFIQYHFSESYLLGSIPFGYAVLTVNGCNAYNFCSSISPEFTSPLFPFTAGDPIGLFVSAEYHFNGFIYDSFPLFDSFSVTLDDISVFDEDKNPITGYALTAASGTAYPATSAAVPEPASIWLLATCLLCIGSLVWRSRARERLRRVSES